MALRHFIGAAIVSASLAACSTGGGGDQSGCSGHCSTDTPQFLSIADVNRVISQAVEEAKARSAAGTIAVTDRVGNVLAVYEMNGADDTATVTSEPLDSNTGARSNQGLEGLASIPSSMAAISKAVTAAFLSTEGNAFTTRTANQIVQEHFNPGETDQPAGPLFGVQFSQLPCSDFSKRFLDTDNTGPKRSPLGLSADPGGIPLYKSGVPVGGIGVIADGIYGIDKNILDRDSDLDEIIALAGTFGFEAPTNRRADRITADGKVLRFTDATNIDLVSAPASAPALPAGGGPISVNGYFNGAFLAGTAFGQADSGVRLSTAADFPGDPNAADFVSADSFIVVDGTDNNRYPPIAGTGGLTAAETSELLKQALDIANRARGQIRRPLGTPARVSITVVDVDGTILGQVRGRDAPIFGLDVSLQKARTAAFFSSAAAASVIDKLPDVTYLNPDATAGRTIDMSDYTTAVQNFLGDPAALTNGAFAFADRSGGNLSRPYFPDGIVGNPHGPLSKPFSAGDDLWSVFSSGFQLDLAFNGIAGHVVFVLGGGPDPAKGCAGIGAPADPDFKRMANGSQIFPGSVPIYKGNTLVGAIGVSGDGVDQDDMIAFLGVHNAGEAIGGINNAPKGIRADQLVPQGTRLRYINCPQAPFIDSNEEDVCNGK